MREVTMLLHPVYIGLKEAERGAGPAPKLFALFRARGITIKAERWFGDVKSLPDKPGPVLLRNSSRKDCSDTELAQACAKRGWLVFYGDRVLREDGTYDEDIVAAVNAFLTRNGYDQNAEVNARATGSSHSDDI